MTDTPDSFDQFSMPGEIPDSGPDSGPDYGVPTQDWLSRGLRHRAGRGWEAARSGAAAGDHAGDPYPTSAALQAQRVDQIRGGSSTQAHWPAGWQPGDPPRVIVLDAGPGADGPFGSLADPATFGPAQQVRFLDALSLHGNVRAAAARVGVSRDTVYRIRRREPRFANLWDAALVHARAAGEAELASRAFDGVATPVFVRGEHVATWRRHDPRYLLGHLARLDRRLGAGGVAEQEVRGRAEAEARAGRFDELLAVLAGHAMPEEFAPACEIDAEMAAEDCENGSRADDAPAVPHCADLPPTGTAVYALACMQALEALDAAVAAGKTAYEDPEARNRADVQAVDRATAKALAQLEQWQAEGHALVDLVLAGGGVGPVEEGLEAARGAQGDADAEEMPMEYKSMALGFASGARESDRDSGGVSDVSARVGDQLTSSSSTVPCPRLTSPICCAAARERSIVRLRENGPRSLIRTVTALPLRGSVTRTSLPNGRVRCAAVSACMSKRSPLAVRRPWNLAP
ncbi:hypothetical protein A9995_01985 [Erythrobacter sp. QSSC1-22B]|nr:hypothetical protein A9995_01985 [Erythrobacter sp. QSSC1-22B]